MKTIAIIGRPNVGKSAIFNCLAGEKISIVHDQPGVTRDRIHAVCKKGEVPFEIVDTGGIGAEPDPDFSEDTRFAADVAMEAADLLLLVVDGQSGMTPLDAELAKLLRASGKPLLLAVNKIDNDRQEPLASEFSRLGLDQPLCISAAHSRGIGELIWAIGEKIDLGEEEVPPGRGEVPRLAIIGRPNAGKSSLVNAILNDRRTIVSEIAGTTRDAVDIPYEYEGRKYLLVDTAGIRHRSKHNSSVEVFSVMRSEKAIERADLNILVIDASQGVTVQDKKIAGLIQAAKKAAIVVLNKWDLVEDQSKEGVKKRVDELLGDLFFLDYAPVIVLSALEKTNVPRLFNMIEKMRQHAQRKIGTGELNRILKEAVDRQPPPYTGMRRLKILYATQVSAASDRRPFGRVEFLLFVNDPRKLSDSYTSYLSARIRGHREFPGLPISFKLRGRKGPE
ncbi:MAG: ribosome biogenesis GTPase Der [Chthoniobacterales bacterium]